MITPSHEYSRQGRVSCRPRAPHHGSHARETADAPTLRPRTRGVVTALSQPFRGENLVVQGEREEIRLQVLLMRPGRFELPRSKRTTRPSTLRATCPSFPTAAETPISSGMMDDLDLVDRAFVVTVLSPRCGLPDDCASPPSKRLKGSGDRRVSGRMGVSCSARLTTKPRRY
jgi:hypothetical protein